MMRYESYRDLSHGTDKKSAEKIRKDGFEIKKSVDSWCGDGIYFYDVKNKAWWAANRKCNEIWKEKKERVKPDVIYADIKQINKEDIFDLRVDKDLQSFEMFIKDVFEGQSIDIDGVEDPVEKIIKIRSMFIGFYALENKKKMVIGNFRQRPQEKHEHQIEFANSLDIVFGIETIYCVKDINIISNIH